MSATTETTTEDTGGMCINHGQQLRRINDLFSKLGALIAYADEVCSWTGDAAGFLHEEKTGMLAGLEEVRDRLEQMSQYHIDELAGVKTE